MSSSAHVDTNEHEDSHSGSEGDNASGSEGSYESGDQSPGTEDEIEQAKHMKSKKTLKRKRRATEPSRFGDTLQSLLNTSAPSALPLSLKPSVARKKNDEKIESKARKALQMEKKEKEDKGRIQDVIGGWGVENERVLRKVAQRGVVKLFNVIQQSQNASQTATEEAKASRGTGKPTLPAPDVDKKAKKKKGAKHQDNLLGRAKESIVDKDHFFDMIRSGGTVAKH